MRLDWTPREANEEADGLTNDEFSEWGFDPSLRREVQWLPQDWTIMREFMTAALSLFKEPEDRKAHCNCTSRGSKKRARTGDRLKDRDPW